MSISIQKQLFIITYFYIHYCLVHWESSWRLEKENKILKRRNILSSYSESDNLTTDHWAGIKPYQKAAADNPAADTAAAAGKGLLFLKTKELILYRGTNEHQIDKLIREQFD